jgi:hypothetical protein
MAGTPSFARIRPMILGALIPVLAIAGCASLPLGNGESASNSSAVPGAASASAEHADVGSGEVASNPQAIPDPLGPTTHGAGEPIEIAGMTVAYVGLMAEGGQLVARFDLISGTAPEDLRLVAPGGEIVAVTTEGGDLVSLPFGSAADPPDSGSSVTLVVGNQLVVFVTGEPR